MIALQMYSRHVTDRLNQFLVIHDHRVTCCVAFHFFPHLNRLPFFQCFSIQTVNFVVLNRLQRQWLVIQKSGVNCVAVNFADDAAAAVDDADYDDDDDDFVSAVDYCLDCVVLILMVSQHQMPNQIQTMEDCMVQNDYLNYLPIKSYWLDYYCCFP